MAATVKRFEYSPLGGELNKHTGIAKKTISKSRQSYEIDKKKINKETINKEKKKIIENQH